MSTDLPQQGPSGRGVPPRTAQPPRSGASAVAIVVALVAALLGFFILKKIDNNSTNIATAGGNPVTNTAAGGATTSPGTAAATTIPVAPVTVAASTIPRGPIVVVVANSSGVKGAAGAVTTSLKALGYKTLPAANASGNKRTATLIFVANGQEAAGAQVISDLKLPSTVVAQPIPADSTQIPLLAASRVGASVVVILGTDLANLAAATTPSAPPTVTKQATINSTAPAKATATTG